MKGGKYTNTLAKIQARRIFRIRDILRNVLPKFIVICMETPCWCPPGWEPKWRTETNKNICYRVLVQKRGFIPRLNSSGFSLPRTFSSLISIDVLSVQLVGFVQWINFWSWTKVLGQLYRFERFLKHAKLYPRATNTVRPYPPSPTPRTVLKPYRQGTIPLTFQHCIGWGGGRGHGFVKWQHSFLRHYLWNA